LTPPQNPAALPSMPTPDWRAEKSGDLIKQVCHFLARAKADNEGSLPDPIAVSRDALAELIRLPEPGKSVMIFLEWDLWTIPTT
jgi:hypothetical protein